MLSPHTYQFTYTIKCSLCLQITRVIFYELFMFHLTNPETYASLNVYNNIHPPKATDTTTKLDAPILTLEDVPPSIAFPAPGDCVGLD